MAKRSIFEGTIIGRDATAEFKDGAKSGDKFYVKMAVVTKGKYKDSNEEEHETHAVKTYDIKVSKEQFKSPDFQISNSIIELEAYDIEVNGKTYYRTYEKE